MKLAFEENIASFVKCKSLKMFYYQLSQWIYLKFKICLAFIYPLIFKFIWIRSTKIIEAPISENFIEDWFKSIIIGYFLSENWPE